ncbi:predicted protein [Naegleria gruberi]|uniref:Predicted protein n=1 Tax=Naegleria gruberi TaxID=5762 RepID=D2VZY8_NAEGR|nr:uncharacterized protein NAEGRDRAFT_53616 [Naegleria gruberi]EFC37613.1 predicted protein [Naegleria gruberi]|eukprot:XP_002670357.1 predicted protein [Naegleria gruberi strain NEG-M]
MPNHSKLFSSKLHHSEDDDDIFSSASSGGSSASSDLIDVLIKNTTSSLKGKSSLDFKSLPTGIILKIIREYYILDLTQYFTILVRMIYHKYRNNKTNGFFLMKLFFGRVKKERSLGFMDKYDMSLNPLFNSLTSISNSSSVNTDSCSTSVGSNKSEENERVVVSLFKNVSLSIEQSFVDQEQAKHKHYYQMIVWLHQMSTLEFLFGGIPLNYVEWNVPYPAILASALNNHDSNTQLLEEMNSSQVVVAGAKSNRKFIIRSDEQFEDLNRNRVNSLIQNTLYTSKEEKTVLNSDILFYIYLNGVKSAKLKLSNFDLGFDHMTTNKSKTNLFYLENIDYQGNSDMMMEALKYSKNIKFLNFIDFPLSDLTHLSNNMLKLSLEIANIFNIKGIENIGKMEKLTELKIIIAKSLLTTTMNNCDPIIEKLQLQNLDKLRKFHLEKEPTINCSDYRILLKLVNCLTSKLRELTFARFPYPNMVHSLVRERFTELNSLIINEPTMLEFYDEPVQFDGLEHFTLKLSPQIVAENSNSTVNLQCKLTSTQFENLKFNFTNSNSLCFNLAPKNASNYKSHIVDSLVNQVFDKNSHIYVISFTNTRISKLESISHMFQKPNFVHVQVLNLLHCLKPEMSVTPELVDQLGKSCPNLITLKWSNFKEKKCFEHLQKHYRHQLQNLSLRHCIISNSKAFGYLFSMSKLKKFSLQLDQAFPANFHQTISTPLLTSKTTSNGNADEQSITQENSTTILSLYNGCSNLELFSLETPAFTDPQVLRELFSKKNRNLTRLTIQITSNKDQLDTLHEILKEVQNGKFK